MSKKKYKAEILFRIVGYKKEKHLLKQMKYSQIPI